MITFKSLTLILPFLAHCGHAATTTLLQTAQLPATFPYIPAELDLAVVQGPDDHPAFIFYQDSLDIKINGLKVATVINGSTITNTETIVPDEELFFATPIAVVQLNQASDLSVFYVNRDSVISEVRRIASSGEWIRGSACPDCIDNHVSYKIASVATILYAMWSDNPQRTAEIRLVFQSSDYGATTIVEAERQNGVWSLHPLVTSQNVPARINQDGFTDVIGVQGVDNQPSLLIYKDQDVGDVRAVTVSNAFSVGHVVEEESIIPATGIFPTPPLAVVQFDQGVGDIGEIRVFYGDSNYILSEIRWTAATGWTKGSACPECIQNHVSYDLLGRSVLYAMGTRNTQSGTTEVRLGFEPYDEDYDDFGRIVEVVSRDGVWSLSF